MQSLNGTILDATALIDFRWLNEWRWLQQNYSPLYIAQELLDSDQLEPPTRQAANQTFCLLLLCLIFIVLFYMTSGLVCPIF